MSLLSVDVALTLKLKSIFPNVVFGPLSEALNNSAEYNNAVMDEIMKLTVPTNPNDAKITKHENNNPIARLGTPPTYEGEGLDRTANLSPQIPLIAVDRINNPFGIEYRANDPSVRTGRFVIEKEQRLRTFPVTPQYQIDIVSDRRVEVDDIWRELVFYLYTKPNVEVIYNSEENEIKENYPIKLLDTDNTTDVESFSDKGRLYRQTISIELTNVQMLFDGNKHVIESIPLRLFGYEGGKRK